MNQNTWNRLSGYLPDWDQQTWDRLFGYRHAFDDRVVIAIESTTTLVYLLTGTDIPHISR